MYVHKLVYSFQASNRRRCVLLLLNFKQFSFSFTEIPRNIADIYSIKSTLGTEIITTSWTNPSSTFTNNAKVKSISEIATLLKERANSLNEYALTVCYLLPKSGGNREILFKPQITEYVDLSAQF